MSVREKDDPALFSKIQEQNLLRQYDLLSNCIEIGLQKGIEAFDKYTLWALNHAAVSNICQLGGRWRECPIRVGDHIPPHFNDVPKLMDIFFSIIHENWTIADHPTALAAFALWNLNWIHPFIEGNGRTARAACYYIICMKQKRILGGTKTIPELIRENKNGYIAGLRAADEAFKQGQYDVTELAKYLADLLKRQLAENVPGATVTVAEASS
jgi:fido (protein-threonine AMPylation protein)